MDNNHYPVVGTKYKIRGNDREVVGFNLDYLIVKGKFGMYNLNMSTFSEWVNSGLITDIEYPFTTPITVITVKDNGKTCSSVYDIIPVIGMTYRLDGVLRKITNVFEDYIYIIINDIDIGILKVGLFHSLIKCGRIADITYPATKNDNVMSWHNNDKCNVPIVKVPDINSVWRYGDLIGNCSLVITGIERCEEVIIHAAQFQYYDNGHCDVSEVKFTLKEWGRETGKYGLKIVSKPIKE